MDKTDETLEDNFAQIEQLLNKMQGENTSLEEAFQCYYKGMKLLQKCNAKIDQIEKDIILIEKGEEYHEL